MAIAMAIVRFTLTSSSQHISATDNVCPEAGPGSVTALRARLLIVAETTPIIVAVLRASIDALVGVHN